MKQKPYNHNDTRGRRSSARPELNMTALALVVGVSPSYLSKLFKGIGTPSVPLAQKLAAEMRIPLDKLLAELEAERVRGKGNGKGNGKGKAKAQTVRP